MSPDWASKPSPVPYANLTQPQTLNLYSYALNNPLTGFDPDGHCDWCQKFWNGVTGKGFQTDAQISAAQRTSVEAHDSGLTPLAGAAGAAGAAGIAGPPFANQLPNLLEGEMSTMNGLGVTPLSPGGPGFAASAEGAAGQVNWTLSTSGDLMTTPALDGITHAATAGGADVVGAGTAQVAGSGGTTMVFDVTAQSGHYMAGATAEQSGAAISAGESAFGAFVTVMKGVMSDIIPPMVLIKPYSPKPTPTID